MKTLLCTVAVAAVALGCFTPAAQAAEIDYAYEVWACDVPTHVVRIYARGSYQIESYHHTYTDAVKRAKQLQQFGATVEVKAFTGYQVHSYILNNSTYVTEFDNEDAAWAYAQTMEDETEMFCWVKRVEQYPGGP